MFVRFYNKCIMCGSIYYEPEKTGCTTPSLSCPDCRKYYARTKVLKARAKGSVDYKFIRQLLDNDRCEYCGKKLSWNEREIEHKTPVKRGGDNSNSNLCISCAQCNLEKGNRTYDEYLEWRKDVDITASEIKTILDAFSEHTLVETEEKIKEDVEIVELEKTRHLIIRDEDGNAVGMRKVFGKQILVKKRIIENHLTSWGRSYNAFCNIVGRVPLEETKIIETIGV